MEISEARRIVLALFAYRRRAGLNLGVSELLAALDAVAGGWGVEDDADLHAMLELLWCKSAEDSRELGVQWENVLAYLATHKDSPTLPETTPESSRPFETPPRLEQSLPPQETIPPRAAASESTPGWNVLPVKAPFTPAHMDEAPDFHSYGPVSSRFMTYTWRYLRRPLPDGPADVLDIAATVERAARQGFFIAPVYRRRERNHAHLLMFLDQNGSMMPFHRFNRDLATTAQHDSALMRTDVFYFHNLIAQRVYADPHLTQPVELSEILGACTVDTVILIVSDAGAARGYRNSRRIRETAVFLARLKQVAAHVAWLNPMPQARWENSSAEMIARFAPMFQMDPEGLSNVIDVLRGQVMGQYAS